MQQSILPDDYIQQEQAQHVEQFAGYYERGLVNPEEHSRLVQDIKYYAGLAGVDPAYIYGISMADFFDDKEGLVPQYAIGFKRQSAKGKYGLALFSRHIKVS